MSSNYKVNWAATVVALLLGLAGFTISLTVDTSDDGKGNTSKDYVFKVNEAKGDGAATKTLTVPTEVVDRAAPTVETNLRAQAPGTTPEVQNQIEDAEARIAEGLPPLPTAGATADIPGCRTQFVRNQSSRRGVRPVQFWMHYTVSLNRPGWGDVNAIVALFDNPSFGASSHFVIDGEGHCAYIVPIENKAWTQAGSNTFAISFEIINSGRESVYLAPAGVAKLRSVLRTLNVRTGIPLTRGRVVNCTPRVFGMVQHKDGGLCSGGHLDISPFSLDLVIKQVSIAPKPSKKQLWVRHRLQIHDQYQKKCKHAYQRKVRPKTCLDLRATARKLDKLIARK